MNAPMFKMPKSLLDASPEALGLPESYEFEDEQELEAGTLEREANELWFRQQEDNYFDEMENF